jgi:hypothetical protein
MKANFGKIVGLAILLVSVTVTSALGQNEQRRGTAGATYLMIPLSARTAALGRTATGGVNTMTGVEGLWANPAALTMNTGTNAQFSHLDYFADINVNSFGIAQALGSSHLAFHVTSWDFGDIPRTTELNPEISNVTFSPSFIQAGVTYARQLTDRIAAGATMKVLSESLDDGLGATGISVDAGMTYLVGESGLRFGVALKNFGPEMSYGGSGLTRSVQIPGTPANSTTQAVAIEAASFELPTLLNFGVTYTRDLAEMINFSVLGNYRSNSFSQDQFSGGLELGFRELFFVRGSYEWQSDMDQTAFEGWAMGAGINLEFSQTGRLVVDYSYTGAEFFDKMQMFTVGVVL